MVDLSVRWRISPLEGLGVVEDDSSGVLLFALLFVDEEDVDAVLAEGEGEVDVPMRYRNTCGIEAWYCASRAKMVAVGPEGR